MKKGKKISQDTKLLSMGAGLLVLTVTIVILAFTFLVNNVLPAIVPDDGAANGETIHFDLEGFEELGL